MNENTAQHPDLDPAAMLKWYVECGVDETISTVAVNHFEIQDKIKHNQAVNVNKFNENPSRNKHVTPPPLTSNKDLIEAAVKTAAACENLEELKQAILSYSGCSLKNTASNTVFCDGNENSDIIIIGEAPGDIEDKAGKPFIGEAGILLDKMFAAIGLNRADDFYITNIIPWRPPGNRQPTNGECDLCLPFLKRHIELFKPKLIITVGGVSANHLLNEKTGITKLRGTWKEYDIKGSKIPLMPLLHPAYLIRQPHYKKQTWHDLLSIKERLSSL